MRRGVTLLEVLVATGLLAACLLPVVSFAQRGLFEAGALAEDLLGRQLAIDLCERYRTSALESLRQLAADPAALARDNFLTPADPAFRRRVELTENVGGQAGLHRVRFVVTWRDRSVSLTRLVHWH